MGANNKKKSSPEKQCDGHSIYIKMHFLSAGKHAVKQNASIKG
ncbi:hypothetical protein SK36_04636 [Citrobacter sp. MGH106]|nr:hypothetical protein SK36_04636 [Citrobacter sp. MGH106]